MARVDFYILPDGTPVERFACSITAKAWGSWVSNSARRLARWFRICSKGNVAATNATSHPMTVN